MKQKSDDKCAFCGEKSTKQKCHLMIQCDCCESWYHSSCQDLSKTEANLISDGDEKGIKWFCHVCKPVLIIKTSNQVATIDEKLDLLNKNMKELTVKVENNHTAWADKSYSEALQSKTDDIVKRVEENTGYVKKQHLLLQQSVDNADAESRKLHAILYGLAESDGPVIDQVKHFMNRECFSQASEPITAFRLGPKSEGKNRPTKIKFKDETGKWDFLKRVNQSFKGTPTFCLLDRTKEVRNEEYKLRQAAKQLSQTNTNEKYRVRDMKIQNQQVSGEWVNMKKEQGHWIKVTSS